MPDSTQTQPVAFNCEGGLVLNRSSFLMQPGEALVLENFEPDVEGGYRRINGHRRYINQIVPVTSADSEREFKEAHEEVTLIFNKIDQDANLEIEYNEFVTHCLTKEELT